MTTSSCAKGSRTTPAELVLCKENGQSPPPPPVVTGTRLRFPEFSIENTTIVVVDRIAVYDNTNATRPLLIDVISSRNGIPTSEMWGLTRTALHSVPYPRWFEYEQSPRILIRFYSDINTNGAGWIAELEGTQACPQMTILSSSGGGRAVDGTSQCNADKEQGVCNFGTCRCLLGWKGASCEVKIQVTDAVRPRGTRIGVYLVLNTIGLLLWCGVLAFVVKFKKSRVMQRSSVVFARLIMLGALLTIIPQYLYINDIPKSENDSMYVCGARLWLPHVGIAITMGTLLCKTWRTYKLVLTLTTDGRPGKKQKQGLNKFEMFFWVALMSVGTIVYCSFWMGLNRPRAQDEIVLTTTSKTRYRACVFNPASDGQVVKALEKATRAYPWLYTGLLIFQGMFIILGAVLTYQTRNAPTEYNESSTTGACIYNFLFTTVLSLGLEFALNASEDSTMISSEWVFPVANLYHTVVTLFLYFGPKMVEVRGGDGDGGGGNSTAFQRVQRVSTLTCTCIAPPPHTDV